MKPLTISDKATMILALQDEIRRSEIQHWVQVLRLTGIFRYDGNRLGGLENLGVDFQHRAVGIEAPVFGRPWVLVEDDVLFELAPAVGVAQGGFKRVKGVSEQDHVRFGQFARAIRWRARCRSSPIAPVRHGRQRRSSTSARHDDERRPR